MFSLNEYQGDPKAVLILNIKYEVYRSLGSEALAFTFIGRENVKGPSNYRFNILWEQDYVSFISKVWVFLHIRSDL